MITANKEYLKKEEEVFPDMAVFAEKTQAFTSKCVVYGSYLNHSALQKECNDIAKLFKNRYPDSYSYYSASKIGDNMYIVEETSNNDKYYWPYIPNETNIDSSCCYLDYDSAVLATIATKYMKTESCNRVADMVEIFEKLIDKPMEE